MAGSGDLAQLVYTLPCKMQIKTPTNNDELL
jgi:hypothetical protein